MSFSAQIDLARKMAIVRHLDSLPADSMHAELARDYFLLGMLYHEAGLAADEERVGLPSRDEARANLETVREIEQRRGVNVTAVHIGDCNGCPETEVPVLPLGPWLADTPFAYLCLDCHAKAARG